MVIGGYISAAGLGLTCPDWPLCPNGLSPDDEYFIEWSHRLIAATTGALVIDTLLHAVLVSIHFGIGILLFAMVLLTTLFAFRLKPKSIQTTA